MLFHVHEGNMYAKNKPDGGACVCFVLPMEEEKKNGGQG